VDFMHAATVLAQATTTTDVGPNAIKQAARLAAGLAIGIGGIGPGIGIGIATFGAMQAIGRNPEAEGPVRTTLVLGAGLAEAVAIYAFVVALALIFAV